MNQLPPTPPGAPADAPGKPSELRQIALGSVMFVGACLLACVGMGLFGAVSGTLRTPASAPVRASQREAVPEQSAGPSAEEQARAAAEREQLVTQIVRLYEPSTMGEEILKWRESARDVPYEQLERGVDSFRGTHVVLRGTVAEIHDRPDGTSQLRVATRGRYDNIYWVETFSRPPSSITARSNVVVVGTLAGSFSYRSQAGWDITLPAVLAHAVIPASEASAAERSTVRARRSGRR